MYLIRKRSILEDAYWTLYRGCQTYCYYRNFVSRPPDMARKAFSYKDLATTFGNAPFRAGNRSNFIDNMDSAGGKFFDILDNILFSEIASTLVDKKPTKDPEKLRTAIVDEANRPTYPYPNDALTFFDYGFTTWEQFEEKIDRRIRGFQKVQTSQSKKDANQVLADAILLMRCICIIYNDDSMVIGDSISRDKMNTAAHASILSPQTRAEWESLKDQMEKTEPLKNAYNEALEVMDPLIVYISEQVQPLFRCINVCRDKRLTFRTT